MRKAVRLSKIPPYPFAELDRKRREAEARGIKVISLAVGDPDRPTPDHVIRALCNEAHKSANHTYPPYEGMPVLRKAVADWVNRRFRVEVDADEEVIVTIGSKEAISHLIWGWVDAGDIVLVPDPAYPVYSVQTLLAGGKPYPMPLTTENDFLPDLSAIPEQVCEQARLMFLNYPNNPTATVATKEFLAEAVEFAREHDILLCHDAAYSEITFDGYEAPSILQVPGSEDVAIEMHSLSKTFNMTGWRVGFTIGCREGIGALGRIKENTDSGQFQAVQMAAVQALTSTDDEFAQQRNERYQRRRDMAIDVLASLGWKIDKPQGTFYLWLPVPRGFSSTEFSASVLENAGVVISPGTAFGAHGEGYVRMSLTVSDDELDEALRRLKTHVRFP